MPGAQSHKNAAGTEQLNHDSNGVKTQQEHSSMVTSEPTAVGMVEQVVRVMGTPVPSDLQSDAQGGLTN